MQDNSGIYIFLFLVVVGIVLFLIIKYTKRLKITDVYFVSGAVKTGKSYLSVALAVKKYRSNVFKWYFRKSWILFTNLFRKTNKREVPLKPMLYSNMKLRYVKFNMFTKEILFRQVRIPDKSIILLDEVSLLADSMLFKDKEINSDLLCFFKLWGHYSHGGSIIMSSHCASELHYAIRRCLGRYMYIYQNTKVPFFSIIKGRELMASDDNQTGVNDMMNTFNDDLEDSMKVFIFSNRYYKYYDCYCYSIFTDDLTYQVNYDAPKLTKKDSLKTDVLVTLQDFKNLDKRTRKD